MGTERSRDELFTSGKASKSTSTRLVQVCSSLRNEFRVKFFDVNCAEMGVEAVEMD